MKYIIYYFLLILVILFFSYINSLSSSTEPFTPLLRTIYRPVVRNTRIIGEGFYNKTSSSISNLFRKFGIL